MCDSRRQREGFWEAIGVMNNSAVDRRPLGLVPGEPIPRLYDRMVEVLRTRHYGRRTEPAHVHWIRRFILFHAPTHPRELAEVDVNRFLIYLTMTAEPERFTRTDWRNVCLYQASFPESALHLSRCW